MFEKSFVLMCCLLGAVLAVEKYSDKYDNINLKEIMESERLMDGYFKCMMEMGKCPPEGKALKENMQDALETGCEKCTDAQVDGTKTMTDFLISKKPQMWKELTAKYDPEGVWRKKYEQRARDNGIIIPDI